MYDCWSDLTLLTTFTSLTSSDLRIELSTQIGFMSRVHHSILSIISFTFVTIPSMTNACIILYSTCFHIKWKSVNAMCFNLVKNGLWRIINQSWQRYLIHFLAFPVLELCHDEDEMIDKYHKGVTLNKLLKNKQSLWFETLWRSCIAVAMIKITFGFMWCNQGCNTDFAVLI